MFCVKRKVIYYNFFKNVRWGISHEYEVCYGCAMGVLWVCYDVLWVCYVQGRFCPGCAILWRGRFPISLASSAPLARLGPTASLAILFCLALLSVHSCVLPAQQANTSKRKVGGVPVFAKKTTPATLRSSAAPPPPPEFNVEAARC